jgi:ribulose-phosphate 3-epimerase
MVKIAPSILSADFSKLGQEVSAVEKAGADLIHIDVMDGHFVPNITIGPLIVKAVRQTTELPLDVHLMIEEPDRYLDQFAEAGSDIITVHVDACRHLHRTIHRIKGLREGKILAGVAINPATPLAGLEEILLYGDLFLIMSVNPGFGGQKFIPGVLSKIKRLKEVLENMGGGGKELEVDGGVCPENSHEIKEAGATILVAGSAVYKSNNYKGTIERLREKPNFP